MSQSSPKTIVLLRHGESLGQTAKRRGVSRKDKSLLDCNLTTKGIQQAKEVTKYPSLTDIDLVVTSPLTRALCTAFYGFQHLSTIPFICYPGLKEEGGGTSIPENQARPIKTILKEHPELKGLYPDFSLVPKEWPNEDNLSEKGKLAGLKDFLLSRNEQKIVIVCHHNIIKKLLPELSESVRNCTPIVCRIQDLCCENNKASKKRTTKNNWSSKSSTSTTSTPSTSSSPSASTTKETETETWPDDAPITEQEMLACAATLKKLYKKDKKFLFFESSLCRPIRKGIGPYARKMQANMFGGKGRSEYEQKVFIQKDKMSQKSQKKINDQKHLNNTTLKKNRIQMLAALTIENKNPLLTLVPDGFQNEVPDGKYSKRRRSNVAVIIVRIIFISPFLFYCLLCNHSFQTNPNRTTNCFQLLLSITTYQLHLLNASLF